MPAAESRLWGDALLPVASVRVPVFSPLGEERLRARRWRRSTRATSSTTAGRACSRRATPTRRSCSGTTSTRMGSCGSRRRAASEAVADLAELISLCAQLRADRGPGDGAAWAATAAAARGGAARGGARRAAGRGDPRPLDALARAAWAMTRSIAPSPRTPSASGRIAPMLAALIFDAVSEGKDVILGMLLVGLLFVAVIAIGELTHHYNAKRKARRRSKRAIY